MMLWTSVPGSCQIRELPDDLTKDLEPQHGRLAGERSLIRVHVGSCFGCVGGSVPRHLS